jgi:hypothetical protein
VAADNASSNDTQVAALAAMPNSFELDSRVRCFNHTLQLSAKALLRPFNAGLGDVTEESADNVVDDLPSMEDDSDDDDDDNDDDDDDSNSNNNNNLPDVLEDDVDDGMDELDNLDADAREELLADTAALRQTVSKACKFSFSNL